MSQEDVIPVAAQLNLTFVRLRIYESHDGGLILGNHKSRAETARRLLARYTNESFRQPEQLRSWFEENKDRIYFTDVGGYKFLVVPQGYLTKK